jgi:cell division septation protein DedD
MRFEIETTTPQLSSPHFDDEATIISARPVVPIAKARAVEKARAAFWICLAVVGCVVLVALGAIVLSYFGNARRSSAVSAPPQSEIIEPKINQPPASSTPGSSDLNSQSETDRKLSAAETQSDAERQLQSANKKDSAATARGSWIQSTLTKSSIPKRDNAAEPGRLVQKRRVQPVRQNDEYSPIAKKPAKKKRGASRIQEIFEGPGPP